MPDLNVSSKSYPFTWPIRVYYEDTDTGGVVYYANYLKFYERARTEALRSIGFHQEQLKNESNLLFVVSSVQADYKRPAVLDDALTVGLRIVKMARTYLVFEQEILKKDEGAEILLNLARIKVACVQGDTYRPKALPESLVSKLSALLG
ncbi:tol-pal system-associated acyl-CoA thioesterase [Oceanospirillum maris]|jgi:acyl-CoA thioester hydrolase|uniref:tol-pal system-associated acyl-CoA thioesterase n=1 Tax=Oceanospirillum maris TaxID=64977 RepID=UPI0004063833|nr:tol-pal system-associated acyl-CoA thioesterase [Oceanospirillum maris]